MPDYKNKLEERVHKQVGPDYQYEAEWITYTIQKRYKPDLTHKTTADIIEIKGRFTAEDRAKHKAVKQQHPRRNITIVFQNPDAKLSKTSNISYADWCDKNGIAWRKA